MQNKEIEEDAKELLDFFKFWLVHGWIPAVRIEQVEKSKQRLENKIGRASCRERV